MKMYIVVLKTPVKHTEGVGKSVLKVIIVNRTLFLKSNKKHRNWFSVL